MKKCKGSAFLTRRREDPRKKETFAGDFRERTEAIIRWTQSSPGNKPREEKTWTARNGWKTGGSKRDSKEKTRSKGRQGGGGRDRIFQKVVMNMRAGKGASNSGTGKCQDKEKNNYISASTGEKARMKGMSTAQTGGRGDFRNLTGQRVCRVRDNGPRGSVLTTSKTLGRHGQSPNGTSKRPGKGLSRKKQAECQKEGPLASGAMKKETKKRIVFALNCDWVLKGVWPQCAKDKAYERRADKGRGTLGRPKRTPTRGTEAGVRGNLFALGDREKKKGKPG